MCQVKKETFGFDGKELTSVTDDNSEIVFVKLEKDALENYRSKPPFHEDADSFKILLFI